MLANYFKIALRSMLRNSVYSFINIFGLAIGIACSILILLWVNDEIQYDSFHKSYDQIYKVYMNRELSGNIVTQPGLAYPLKEAIKNKSSQVKRVVLTNWGEGNVLSVGENRINKFGLSATEDFFKMFSFKILKGNPNRALSDPSFIVLTESTAKALFGNQDPINQFVKVDNKTELEVSAIIQDVPDQSTFKFDYVLPFAYFESAQEWIKTTHDRWNIAPFHIYAELQENASPEGVNASIRDLVKNNYKEEPTAQVFLHPMSKWRLYSKFENGKVAGGTIQYVQLFSTIAIFVLVIACINFMNLSTARSESRAREVGIRKSLGSRRKQLIVQFLGESLWVSFIAFFLAILFVQLVLPAYNTLVGKKLFIDYANPILWLCAFVIILVTGSIAGSYPAFYLSSFLPAKVLKGKVQSVGGANTFRKTLVTAQFAFSIFLIIGTWVIYQQITHVKKREVGYDRENLLLIWTNSEIEAHFQTLKQELLSTGVVKSVCKSNSPITQSLSNNLVEWPGMPPGQRVSFTILATEYDFTETMGIHMLQGRDFSRDFKSDSAAVVINRVALDRMELKNPLGEKLKALGQEFTIIGVMENIIIDSPYEPILPLAMFFIPQWSSTISVRTQKTDDLPASIEKIESVFKKYVPFSYRFADTEFAAKFAAINLIGTLAKLFAALAVIITCLGLFGLAAFTTEKRTKEIGIRKVMGASVLNLVALISKDFSRIVLFAFVISAPIAWWTLNNFLERYPYRIEMSLWIFLVVGLIALTLTLLIVSTQALKAATTNPVKSLRNE